MDLQIRNFGAIENADVKFDGLTVIAGENDTGKSTVGKLVFSVIKAISRYEEDLDTGKEKSITKLVEELYLKLRRNSIRDRNFQEISAEFYTKIFLKELSPFITNQPSLFQEFSFDNDGLNSLFKKKRNFLKGINFSEEERYSEEELIATLDEIQSELKKDEDKSEVLKKALKKALVSEFHGEFSPKGTQQETKINFKEGVNKLFEIQGKKNTIHDFIIHDEVPPFEDVTFIESPLVIQLHDAITQARTIFEINVEQRRGFPYRPTVSLHIKDLIAKIRSSEILVSDDLCDEKQKEILKGIQEVIRGNWAFDKTKRDFIFSRKGNKNSDQKIRSINTASGIKSFGIIQLLLLAEVINDRTLLIIDEPETHLHPKWQVEYAKVICLLVKHEIPVLLTSHSPYLIEALRYYSKEYDIERFTNYYLAERNDNGLINIEHVNDEMNRVFLKLSEPFQKLLWEEA